MANVKITIEMNDEEYAKYKDFLKGNYIPKDTSIFDFLEKQGFTKEDISFSPKPENISAVATSVWRKGRTKVLIRAEAETGDTLAYEMAIHQEY